MTRRKLFRENDICIESTTAEYSQNDNRIQNYNSENSSLGIYIYIFIYMTLLFFILQ